LIKKGKLVTLDEFEGEDQKFHLTPGGDQAQLTRQLTHAPVSLAALSGDFHVQVNEFDDEFANGGCGQESRVCAQGIPTRKAKNGVRHSGCQSSGLRALCTVNVHCRGHCFGPGSETNRPNSP
jgi:hypothetical protein